jgi:hypothetical protein
LPEWIFVPITNNGEHCYKFYILQTIWNSSAWSCFKTRLASSGYSLFESRPL